MAYQYPSSLQELITELSRLPGVGPKAAQRLAFHMLNHGQDSVNLSRALINAKNSVRHCPRCGNFTDRELCPICSDPDRDHSLLCVVESVADIISLERSGRFNGIYHVLGGVISPLDGVGPDDLNLSSLLQRAEAGELKEVILATNPTAEGEATALYLAKKLKALGVTVSRIAHGMPVGGSLAFTDEATLDLAIADRKPI